MIQPTNWFVCCQEGSWTWSLSAAMWDRAALSKTTTESAFCVNLLIDRMLL